MSTIPASRVSIGRIISISFAKSAQPRPARLMSQLDRQRLVDKVGAMTCSSTWRDQVAAQAERQGINPNVQNIEPQLADRGLYPPRADLGRENLPRRKAVRMRRCDVCGRIVPPNNMMTHEFVRICDDCRIQPDADLDANVDRELNDGSCKVGGARAPSAQLCVLLKGSSDSDGDQHYQDARQQLRSLGLTDGEITVLALTHAGYSTRSVAELCRWSQVYVRKLLGNATRKLRRSGLYAPRRSKMNERRGVIVDPIQIDTLPYEI